MKRLILCCDGTWQDEIDGNSASNVAKIHGLIRSEAADGTQQISTYLEGVGTGGFLARVIGGATGAGLTENVLDGYNQLAESYDPGDELFLFGFSRGAYTARAIAGLIGSHGLMRQTSKVQQKLDGLKAVFRTFARHRRGRNDEPAKDVHDQVAVECVGVWDTVGSLGVPLRIERLDAVREDIFEFHDTSLGGHVRTALHALAIDEKREHFEAALWTGEQPQDTRVVEQVWFPGVHSDVGGGYPEDGLADIALGWMIERTAAETGLEFDNEGVAKLKGAHDGLLHESRQSKIFALDRHKPNIRPIGGGAGLNESVHSSALARFGMEAPAEDEDGNIAERAYRPVNLARVIDRFNP